MRQERTAQRKQGQGAKHMSEYFLYIVRCEDDSLYTGITVDVARRMAEHRSQMGPAAKYTRSHKAVELVACWSAPDRSTASKGEYHVKRLDRNGKDKLVFYPERITSLFEGAEALSPIAEEELARYWSASE